MPNSSFTPSKQGKASWWLDSFFILFLLGTLFFFLLGSRPLFVPDEGRYAEIAREMTASHNYLTPYLNYIKYFEKPILFYWLESLAIQLGGLNLWSLRSVNALLGLWGCLITYLTARQLYGRFTGLVSAFILGTSILYVVMARMISLDATVTVFIMASLYAFILGVESQKASHRRYFLYAAACTAALAVLTKGLIGIVFPLMIIGTWISLLGEWRSLKSLPILSSIFIFLLVVLPWHILVAQANPEFFHFYFIEQHILRYTHLGIGHYQPFWFFIPYLIAGFFPWIIFLPQSICALPLSWAKRKQHRVSLFFLLWALLIFLFFSFSKSKLIPYILPMLPPLAILVAYTLTETMKLKMIPFSFKLSYSVFVLVSIGIAVGYFFLTLYISIPFPQEANLLLYSAAFILVISSFLSFFYAFRSLQKALLFTVLSTSFFLMLSLAAIPYLDTRSILPLASRLKPLLKPTDEVITFNQYYQDLPFYLERRISILNWRNELTFGMQHQDTSAWMINNKSFWKRWHSPKRIFMIISQSHYQSWLEKFPQEKIYILGKTLSQNLVSNQPLSF